MYYKLKRNKLLKWLLGWHLKIYVPILCILCLMIIFTFKFMEADNITNETSSTAAVSEDNTESSTTFIADNYSYMIRVNKAKNFITVFKMDANHAFTNPYKTFRCSVNSNVPTGKMGILEKSFWRKLDNNQYGQYTSKIGATYYIHSVPYSSESNSTLIVDAYNNLGNPAKIGSIYLALADAKWIYENCAINTVIEVYEDANESPAIALAEKGTVAAGTGIDPSDNQTASKIVQTKIDYLSGVRDKTVSVGSTVNLWENIRAVDVNRNDITGYVTISGTVNTSVPGSYVITYKINDIFNTNISYNSVITVVGN